MVASAPLIKEAISGKRLRFLPQRQHIVVDPVGLHQRLPRLHWTEGGATDPGPLPLAEVITPNLPEAEVLARRPIRTEGDMEPLLGPST